MSQKTTTTPSIKTKIQKHALPIICLLLLLWVTTIGISIYYYNKNEKKMIEREKVITKPTHEKIDIQNAIVEGIVSLIAFSMASKAFYLLRATTVGQKCIAKVSPKWTKFKKNTKRLLDYLKFWGKKQKQT